jgi:hypothetical protein
MPLICKCKHLEEIHSEKGGCLQTHKGRYGINVCKCKKFEPIQTIEIVQNVPK